VKPRTGPGPKVFGVILTYKHASYLEELYARLPDGVLDAVLVSDDHSGDGIEAVAARLGIPCYSHPRRGYGANIKYGWYKALELGADYIVEIHGDGQYDVTATQPAVDRMNEGYDYVFGSRFIDMRQPLRDEMSWIRYVANVGLSAIASFVLRAPLTEYHTGFRVYSRRMLTRMDLSNTSDDFIFGFEIIALAVYHGMRLAEVPVRCFYMKDHTSISLPKSAQYAFQMAGVLFKYLLTRIGVRPRLFAGVKPA